jgi:hypothetical protein
VVPPFLRRRRSLPPSQDRYRQRRSPAVLPFSIGMSFDLCPDCYAFLPWLACVCLCTLRNASEIVWIRRRRRLSYSFFPLPMLSDYFRFSRSIPLFFQEITKTNLRISSTLVLEVVLSVL